MIWNTEVVDNRKRYTSTAGPVVFTITEKGKQFVLVVELTIKGSVIKLYTDRCETLKKCMRTAEWHLRKLQYDANNFITMIDLALNRDKIILPENG